MSESTGMDEVLNWIMPGTTLKHGNHNQATHGQRGGGESHDSIDEYPSKGEVESRSTDSWGNSYSDSWHKNDDAPVANIQRWHPVEPDKTGFTNRYVNLYVLQTPKGKFKAVVDRVDAIHGSRSAWARDFKTLESQHFDTLKDAVSFADSHLSDAL